MILIGPGLFSIQTGWTRGRTSKPSSRVPQPFRYNGRGYLQLRDEYKEI
jgi:hypothetical protein